MECGGMIEPGISVAGTNWPQYNEFTCSIEIIDSWS